MVVWGNHPRCLSAQPAAPLLHEICFATNAPGQIMRSQRERLSHQRGAIPFTCSIFESSSFASDPRIKSNPLFLISSTALLKSVLGQTTILETNKSPEVLRRPITPIG